MQSNENQPHAGVNIWQLAAADQPEVLTPLGNSPEEVLHNYPRQMLLNGPAGD